tara:strand:+ start:7258 stop:8541 length:1284 start_codon:yes stop_codon:yes gene_type:complete
MSFSEKEKTKQQIRNSLLKENKRLLLEDNMYNGLFQVFWGEVEKGFSNFGKVLVGSVKKVSRAAVLWITVNFPFTPFKTKREYSKLFAEYERDQKANQREIDQALKPLEENLGPVKASMFAFAPGAILSAYAFEGARNIGSDEFKGFLDSSGLSQLPIVGPAIEGLTTAGGFWFDDFEVSSEGEIEDKGGILSKTFNTIQKAFINPVGLVIGESRNIIFEGEDIEQPSKEKRDIQRVLTELERIGAYKEIEKIGKRELTLKKNLMRQLIDPLETAYKFSAAILASTSPQSFIESIGDIKDPGIKSLNVSTLEADFKNSVDEIKASPSKMEELKKAAKSEGIDMDTDPDAEAKLNEYLWKIAKKDMVKVAADGVEESYATVTEFITGDIGPKEIEILLTTDVGTEYAKFIQETMEKLDSALTDVRRLL